MQSSQLEFLNVPHKFQAKAINTLVFTFSTIEGDIITSEDELPEKVMQLYFNILHNLAADESRATLAVLNRDYYILPEEQKLASVRISMDVIAARPYHFILQEALDILLKSINDNILPSKEQLEKFIQADLLDDKRDCVWQFSRSRAISVFEALITKAEDPAYAELAAVALAAQSRRVSVKRDMGPLMLFMEKAAGNMKGAAAEIHLKFASSALKRKLGR